MTSSHSSKDTDTFSISALGMGSASANAEIIQLVDVKSTSVVEKSTSIFKTLLKELLLSTPLGYASNKNLKWPYDLSAHQVTQSSCHYYNVMVTESSIQKKLHLGNLIGKMISSQLLTK